MVSGNKLGTKPGTKFGAEITLEISSIFVGGYNDENNFWHKLLLNNTQGSRRGKAFANTSSTTYIKISKTQLYKIKQSGAFLGKIHGSLLKTSFSLMKNVLKLLAKCLLIPLVLTATESVTGSELHNKIIG